MGASKRLLEQREDQLNWGMAMLRKAKIVRVCPRHGYDVLIDDAPDSLKRAYASGTLAWQAMGSPGLRAEWMDAIKDSVGNASDSCAGCDKDARA